MNTCVVGLSFGDEGKGKIADILAHESKYVVRYNGGANAGHTVQVGDRKYALHLLPSGIAAGVSDLVLVLAAGMAIHPITLHDEIWNSDFPGDIVVSADAHVVMPWHLAADIRKGGKIGTTRRGIGPCYADKMHRWNAIRMGDLLEKLEDEKMQRFFAVDEAFHGTGLWESYHKSAKFLAPQICDTGEILRKAVKAGENILFESANGIHLDINHGTFPYVTSSGVGPAAIPQACGLPNLHLDRIVGVMKCYATRVGEGPFPSEIDIKAQYLARNYRVAGQDAAADEQQKIIDIANVIREQGKEYGTTTGRPRRIGWLDIDMTQKAVALTGATEIALMHTDTVAKLDESMPFGVWHKGEFKSMERWKDVHAPAFKRFVSYLQGMLEIPVNMVSFGPSRRDTVFYK